MTTTKEDVIKQLSVADEKLSSSTINSKKWVIQIIGDGYMSKKWVLSGQLGRFECQVHCCDQMQL